MFTVIVLLVIAGALVYVGTRNKSSSSNSSSGSTSGGAGKPSDVGNQDKK